MVHALGKGVQLGRVQRTVIKIIPKKKKCKKAKWLSEEALQIAEKGREALAMPKEKRKDIRI